ncbi:MAG TPA: DUF1501 domain-containing protein [Pirellulales bacterium]|nr:DUF1501 domain-containing protein [Pirellulales bacterium]
MTHPCCPGPQPAFGLSRRMFLQRFGMGLGGIALADLMGQPSQARAASVPGVLPAPHFAPQAKRVIYLFQSGGPSQLETFDYKPLLNEKQGQPLPDEVRRGQRLTGMSGNQASLPLAGSIFPFRQHGQSGAWISDLLPHTAKIVDRLCIVRSMYTEAINHDPAITFLQTGSQIAGRPSIGAWLNYGLGSDNADLPAFVVLVTKGKGGQPLYARLWGSGFLPSGYQGVQFRAGKDPVLYLNNPAGVDSAGRRALLDRLRELHELELAATGDGELNARIEQYEMAFRMQTSVPEATKLDDEPAHVFDLYGPDAHTPGTFAANCLLARRLAERGVKFIQLYHQGWDQHGGLPAGIKRQCQETDQPSAALIADLEQRGLLDETLVIWGGEFGRTNYSQGKLTATDYGRDHHPRCFSIWLAGGGAKPGTVYGETCPYGYNLVRDGIHVHDFHATLLHLLGIDHERLTYRFQGRDFRLTDVHGRVVKEILA